MLVLNRRPGESIVIEPGVEVTVLSVTDRRVWISVEIPELPPLRVSAVATGPTAARLELGPLAGVTYDADTVTMEIGTERHPSSAVHATLALDRRVGQRVQLGEAAWVAVAAVNKGNPCIAFGGPIIGAELSITLIRPAGNYVRLGVDAPQRRVFRRELWESVRNDGERSPGPGGAGHDGPASPFPADPGVRLTGAPERSPTMAAATGGAVTF